MLRTTAFGYVLTLIVIIAVIGVLQGHWIPVLSLGITIAVLSVIVSMGGYRGNDSNAPSLQRSQTPSPARLPKTAPTGTPTGPGSCVHLTKTMFDEVSAALVAGQMTQKEIAQKFNIPATVVSRVKKGKITVSKLAD